MILYCCGHSNLYENRLSSFCGYDTIWFLPVVKISIYIFNMAYTFLVFEIHQEINFGIYDGFNGQFLNLYLIFKFNYFVCMCLVYSKALTFERC